MFTVKQTSWTVTENRKLKSIKVVLEGQYNTYFSPIIISVMVKILILKAKLFYNYVRDGEHVRIDLSISNFQGLFL